MMTAPRRAANPLVPAIVLLAGTAALAVAQDGTPATTEPEPGSQAVAEAEQNSAEAVTNAEVILPARPLTEIEQATTPRPVASPPRPGLTGGVPIGSKLQATGFEITPARVLPERAFLNRRSGLVTRGPNETWIFVPDPDEREPGEKPMVLAPCRTLERLIASVPADQPTGRFTLSGEVLLYRDWNHLLPTAFSLGVAPAPAPTPDPSPAQQPGTETGPAGDTPPPTADGTPSAEPTDDAAADPPPDPADALADDPEVAALIADLTSRRAGSSAGDAEPGARVRQLDRATPRTREAPETSVGLVNEGVYLAGRRARMVRAADGRWAVSFDNDTQGRSAAVPDVPMVLIPGAVMQRMELTAERFGDSAAITVSGRVFAFGQSNYLLPTMFVLELPGNVIPLQ